MKKKFLVMLALGTLANVHAKELPKDQGIKNSETTKAQAPKLQDVLEHYKTDLNIKVINSLGAMRDSQVGKVAAKELEGKREVLAKEIQKEEQKIAQAVSEFKGKSATLSEAAREKEEKNLRTMENNYKNKIQESEYDLKIAMQKTSEELSKEVKDAVSELAKREKIDLVIDGMSGQTVYVSEKVDITDKVVKEMNKNHEVKLAQANLKKDDIKLAEKKPEASKSLA